MFMRIAILEMLDFLFTIGNTQPSLADLMMTKKLKEGGELLEIKVLDHLILTKDRFYSFADDGVI